MADNHTYDVNQGVSSTITADHCLIENPIGHSIEDGVNSNIVGHDPKLGPLRNYGGSTESHVLLSGSPAIDVGSNPNSLTLDQRGTGYARVIDGDIDIGALENTYDTTFSILTVINTNDSGAGSLRQIIADAITGDTIVFDGSAFPDATTGTITLSSGEFVIDKALIITGGGNVTIDANNSSRIFNIDDGIGSLVNVVLSGLILTNGNSGPDTGGSILNKENLNLSNSTVSNNITTTNGGALYNDSNSIMAVTGCTISNNTAQTGGGLYNHGTSLSIDTTTLINNSASNGGGGMYAATGTVSISDSSVTHNTAGQGGGFFFYSSSTTATISNSTLSSNTASSGSGLFFFQSTGTISNSTIASNAGDYGIKAQYGTVNLISSIVADNNTYDVNQGVSSTITADHSLIENPIGHSITDGVNSNIVGHDPKLGPLKNYGGSTESHVLLSSSPAIDMGSNPNSLTLDQRGTGYVRVIDGDIDMGALENTYGTTFSTLTVINTNDSGAGSLRQIIADAITGDTIVFDGSAFPDATTGTITLSSGEFVIDKALIITGGGNVTIDANNSSRIFNIDDDIGSLVNVVLSGLVLTNGDNGAGTGGAILNKENISLSNSTISNSTATTTGGAIHNTEYARCTLSNAQITDNTAGTDGGALYNDSNSIMAVTGCVFSGNTAQSGGGLFHKGASLSIDTTTLINNSASNGGGGMYAAAGTVSISDSSVTYNTAAYQGGGIHFYSSSTTATISNSTFSSNTASSGSGLSFFQSTGTISNSTIASNAGDYGIKAQYATVNLVSSIVADNNTYDVNQGVSSTITADHCLIENPIGHFITDGVNSNIVGQDPMLFPLGDYGGFSQTHAIMDGSPVISMGVNLQSLSTDQRGASFDRVVGVIDIGAIEYGANSSLIVTSFGGGFGVVTSTPGTINCGTSCSEQFDPNISIALTASPQAGSAFTGWSGACSGSTTCIVEGDSSVEAGFELEGDINLDGSVGLADAVTALQITSGIVPAGNVSSAVEINGDGKIGVEEAVFSLRVAAEM